MVAVGNWTAVVATNTATELQLAPVRPGATTAWAGGTPPAGAGYRLPDVPANRAGITLAAPTWRGGALVSATTTADLTLRHNRVWDSQQHKSQTHGLWVTGEGTHGSADFQDNDFAGNAVAATRVDTPQYA